MSDKMNENRDESTPSKMSKVTILSDIVLKPLKGAPPQDVNLSVMPPLTPLANKIKIADASPGSNNTHNVSIDNNQKTLSTTNACLAKAPATEKLLKRKMVNHINQQDTAKKLKSLSPDKQLKTRENDLNEENTVFNYMTGAYESVIRKELEKIIGSPEKNEDVKDEITIQETIILKEEIHLKVEESEDSKQGVKLVTKPDRDSILDNNKPTLTIDLTDDDETEPNISIRNKIFIQNVVSLQNAINSDKLKFDPKIHNVVKQNPTSPVKNLQYSVNMIKSPNDTKRGQPVILLVQNNPNFHVPQNTASAITPINKNLQGNLVLISNNLNVGTNITLPNKQSPGKVTNLVLQTNHTSVGNEETSLQPRKTFFIGPKNVPMNLVANVTSDISSNSDKSLVNKPVNASASQSSISTQNKHTSAKDSTQNNQTSAQNIQTQHSTNDNFTCDTCLYKGRSKRELALHIFNAHLKDDFELNLKCKMCNFETDVQGVMETHDLGHGNRSQNQEDNVRLSNNVEIRIRPAAKQPEVCPEASADNVVHKNSPDFPPVDIVELSDSEDELSRKNLREVSIIYRCFDCSFKTSNKQFLQHHAVQHPGSNFQCSKHVALTDTCLECEYKRCLICLKTKTFLCKKCGYTVDRKSLFDVHLKNQCGRLTNNQRPLLSSNSEQEKSAADLFKCFHCTYIASKLAFLKIHSKKHFGGAFACDIHKSKSLRTCSKCIYEMVLTDNKVKKEKKESLKTDISMSKKGNKSKKKLPGNNRRVTIRSSDSETEEISGDFQCFHCTYVTTTRFLLKLHAAKHCKQTFKCDVHAASVDRACLKCVYAVLLKELKNDILLCRDCGFRTLRPPTFDRHISKKENCEKYRVQLAENGDSSKSDSETNCNEDPTICAEVLICAKCNFRASNQETFVLHEQMHDVARNTTTKLTDNQSAVPLNCFDCNEFCTEDREKLKNHAVMHNKKTFACDKHSSAESAPDCGKCIYFLIKQDVERNIKVCKRCDFKTIQTDLFVRHKSSKCKDHMKEDDDDYNPESGLENYSSIGRPNLRRKVKLLNSDGDSKSPNQELKNLECFDCGRKCATRSELESHLITHLPNKCYDCGARFTSRLKLWQHAAGHKSNFHCTDHKDNSQNGCDHCFYAFIQETIRRHYFRCFDCPSRIFMTILDLMDHMETKHRESKFKCDLHEKGDAASCDRCRYSYIIGGLSKKLVFSCADCKGCVYPFATLGNLKRHITSKHWHSETRCLYHIDNRTIFECKACLFEKILVNIRSKENTLTCSECPLPYLTRGQLKAHIRIVHEGSTFQCTIHTLGDINEKCTMCAYENIVVLMNS